MIFAANQSLASAKAATSVRLLDAGWAGSIRPRDERRLISASAILRLAAARGEPTARYPASGLGASSDAGHRARSSGDRLDVAVLSSARIGRDLAQLAAVALWEEAW